MARPRLDGRPSKVNRSNRLKRTPINGYRDILGVQGQEAGWHYCWVNEENVDRYLNGSYEFVAHEVTIGDKKIDAASQVGGRISKPMGNGVTGYLMRCTDEVFAEEQDILNEEVDQIEAGLRQSLNAKDDGRYGEFKVGRGQPSDPR